MITARAIAAIALTVLVAMVMLRAFMAGGEKIEDTAKLFQPSEMRQQAGSTIYKRGYDF